MRYSLLILLVTANNRSIGSKVLAEFGKLVKAWPIVRLDLNKTSHSRTTIFVTTEFVEENLM
jgi:hypothetical protein